jgi:hypothetical protein
MSECPTSLASHGLDGSETRRSQWSASGGRMAPRNGNSPNCQAHEVTMR